MNKNYCTRCKNEIIDMAIIVDFKISVGRVKNSGIFENIPNLENNSREVLCDDCFNKFSLLMEGLNIKYNKKVEN